MSSTMAIETRDLTRSFGSKNAVRGLNLQVPSVSIYGFLGPNGAGKTTTIRLILGLIRPSSGSVFLNGREMTSRPHHERLRDIGALVETPALYPNLTGRENLEVARRLLDVPVSSIDRTLALMELSGDADRTVRSYSLGMRQRLGLALACLGDPRILILDEPSNGLDPEGVRDLRSLLRQISSEGVTVFISSHQLAEIDQIAEHIGILRQGELIYQGRLQGLRKYSRELHLQVDDRTKASECLEANGWSAGKDGDGSLRITVRSEKDSASIVRLLVTRGVDVYDLHAPEPTLEDLFLQLLANSEGEHAGLAPRH
jgi:ABC-type multidrug transport system ATPase subunit